MIKGAERLNNFIEQYKTHWRDAIDNMKNYYDNEDEYWWIIQELLDKNIELQEIIDKAIKWVNDYITQWTDADEVVDDMECLLKILKGESND